MVLLAALLLGLAQASSVLVPHRVSFEALDRNVLRQHSLVSITGIPNFHDIKKDAVAAFLASRESGVTHKLADGSTRRTLARQGVLGEEATGDAFQDLVSKVTGAAMHEDLQKTVGPYLDHFHVYTKQDSSENLALEWHVDQGVLLAFTPGSDQQGDLSGDFFMRTPSGAEELVEFEAGVDQLVLLVGDGMAQIFGDEGLPAVPHALRLSQGSRVWFGRMFLPDPTSVSASGAKFGDIRSALERGEHDVMLGCSTPEVAPRLLAEDVGNCTNEPDTSYCWHGCMSHAEFGVSPEECASRNLELGCANDDGFLWTGRHDDQFAIACIDPATAQNFTYADEDNSDPDDHSGHSHGSGDHDHKSTDEKSVAVSNFVLGAGYILAVGISLLSGF